MAGWDSMKASLFALVRAALPRIDYYAMYHGKVVSWNSDQTVDVAPDDPALPTMSKVPFMQGLPGVSAKVVAGTAVLVGWKNGDPGRKYACLWLGGEHVLNLTLNADQIILGGADGAQKTVLGDVMRQILATISTHTHPPIPSGGGPVVASLDLANLPDPRASNVSVR